MDDQQQVSGQEQENAVAPQFSDVSDDKRTSDVDAVVAKALEKLIPEVEKRVQAVKDKRFSDIEKKLDSLSQLAELEEMGVKIPEEVKTEMRLRNLEKTATPKADSPANLSTEEAIGSAKEILSEAKIEVSDPEVVKLWQTKQYSNTPQGHKEMLTDVARLVVRRATSPAPNSAQGAAKPGGTTPPEDIASLEERYNQALARDPFSSATKELAKQYKAARGGK